MFWKSYITFCVLFFNKFLLHARPAETIIQKSLRASPPYQLSGTWLYHHNSPGLRNNKTFYMYSPFHFSKHINPYNFILWSLWMAFSPLLKSEGETGRQTAYILRDGAQTKGRHPSAWGSAPSLPGIQHSGHPMSGQRSGLSSVTPQGAVYLGEDVLSQETGSCSSWRSSYRNPTAS